MISALRCRWRRFRLRVGCAVAAYRDGYDYGGARLIARLQNHDRVDFFVNIDLRNARRVARLHGSASFEVAVRQCPGEQLVATVDFI